MRNSSLFLVLIKRSLMNSIASTGFISAKYFLMIHMRCMVFSSSNMSSLRVLEEIRSMAGKILRLAILRSSCSSMVPVPLNSSKMTSSILEPVSVKAVAIMDKDNSEKLFGQSNRDVQPLNGRKIYEIIEGPGPHEQ